MMYVKQTLAALLVLVTLTACGFSPMHARSSTSTDPLSNVEVGLIADRLGQLIRNQLLEVIRPHASTRYHLAVEVEEQVLQQSVTQDNEETLAYVIVTARYSLVEKASGTVIGSGQVRSQTSFDLVESNYAEIAAKRTSRELLARDIARNLHNRVKIALARVDQP